MGGGGANNNRGSGGVSHTRPGGNNALDRD